MQNCVRQYIEEHAPKCYDPILEIGSYRVDGQEELANMRPFFPDHYTGLDTRIGLGVDCNAMGESLPFRNETFKTVLCLETLEHCKYPLLIMDEIHRVLVPKGILIFSVPFYFEVHGYPSDYWRFTPACVREILLKIFRKKSIIQYPKNTTKPISVLGWAQK